MQPVLAEIATLSLRRHITFARGDRIMKIVCALFVLALLPTLCVAAVKTENITYKVGDKTYKGMLAYDDAVKGKRPGILVVHEFWGLNDYAKKRAEKLAELGYVAFAADMY